MTNLFRARNRTAVLLLVLAANLISASGFCRSDAPDYAAASRMGRGINILGYDGIWEGGTDAPFRLQHLARIKRAGFGHVRINLFGFKFMDASDILSDAYLERLDLVIERTIAAGLVPVIDEHDTQVCQVEIETCTRKLAAFWRQVSARYAGRFPNLIFEILNEPGGNMTWAQWNSLAREMLAIIRSDNPDRIVIIGAINTPQPSIDQLDLPSSDRRIIVTFHYYEPFDFTHQGAPWDKVLAALPLRPWGSDDDKAKVTQDFQRVREWSERAGRPIYLGEFGAYEKAPRQSRANYLGFVARTAERHGWPWAIWQFDHDFAIFDTERQRWQSDLLRAVIPH